MLSTLERPPAVAVDEPVPESPEISIEDLGKWVNGVFTLEKMAAMLDGVTADDLYRAVGTEHIAFCEVRKAIAGLDAIESVGGSRKQRKPVRVAPALQKEVRRWLGTRKITVGDDRVEAMVCGAVFEFLEKCVAAEKQAMVNRLVRVDLNPPPLDLLLLAESFIAESKRAAEAEERAARAAREVEYAKLLCTFRAPTPSNVKDFAAVMGELKLTRERVVDDLGKIHKVLHWTAEWVAVNEALRKLVATMRNDPDRGVKIRESQEYKSERQHRANLNSICTSNPLWFTPGTWPPQLRYPPVPEESTTIPHAQA